MSRLMVACMVVVLTVAGSWRVVGAADEAGDGQAQWRDPFWPVDYVPESRRPKPEPVDPVNPLPVQPTPREPEIKIEWPELSVTAQGTTGGKAVAMLDNGVGFVEEGQEISVTRKGVIYRWKVQSIDKNGAHLVRLTATPAKAAANS